jgi:hypothetical protein
MGVTEPASTAPRRLAISSAHRAGAAILNAGSRPTDPSGMRGDLDGGPQARLPRLARHGAVGPEEEAVRARLQHVFDRVADLLVRPGGDRAAGPGAAGGSPNEGALRVRA